MRYASRWDVARQFNQHGWINVRCITVRYGQYCYPLTVTDHASCYLLLCEALDSVPDDPCRAAVNLRIRGDFTESRSPRGGQFSISGTVDENFVGPGHFRTDATGRRWLEG